jgi:hypothetical protein
VAESIFTVQTPANADEDDGVELTLGTRFVPAVNGTITAIRWFFPASPTVGTITGRLYSWTSNTVGTLLGSNNFVAPTPGAWNTTAVSVPVTAGQPYVTAVYTPLGEYVSTSALFASAIINGNLTATADTPTEENGKFIAGNAYPNDSFNGNGYFVDVVFEAASGAVTGNAGPANEADTANAVAPRKSLTTVTATEHDTANVVTARKTSTTVTAIEHDTVNAVTAGKSVAVTVATEHDTVNAVTAHKSITVGLATEHDTANAVTPIGGGTATVTTFVDGPCEVWPVLWPCPMSAEVMAVTGVALQAATDLLWVRSGRRFSLCTTTMRPCRADCEDDLYRYDGWWAWPTYPRPRFYQGVWTNVVCGLCSNGCSCSRVSHVRLPTPVSSITSVVIDGQSLPASAYQLYDYRDLIRQDGGEFPRCNNLSVPNGSPGTWSVTAVYGEGVPTLGQIAVGELAFEIARALACDNSCQLPQPVQQLTRQGVSMSFLDPNEVFASGRIGLRMTDLFLSTYNPDGLRAQARVYSVDHPFGRIPT